MNPHQSAKGADSFPLGNGEAERNKREHMAVYLLINTAFQLIVLIGAVWLVGFLISIINKTFYGMFHSTAICYATGVIGTPIHELSHAFFCVLFAHKVLEIKLFQIDPDSGALGYVRHTYNPKNIYARIGNFFIGVAPIIGNSLVILLLMWLLLPQTFSEVWANINAFAQSGSEGAAIIGEGVTMVGSVFVSLFTGITAGFPWWIFMLVAFCLALHMNLSKPDIQNGLSGCALFAAAIIVINLVLGFLPVYKYFAGFMTTACAYVIVILLISLIFSLVTLLIGFLIKTIVSLIRRK